jgi:hypothetical protein
MDVRTEHPSRKLARIGMLILMSQFAACGGGSMNSSPAPVPPAPPPVATFTVHPKYFIGSVIYVPPGPGSSITYGFGTMLGTTVSTASSWTNGSSAGSQIGVEGVTSITFGDLFGGATANSVDLQDTFTNMSAPFAAPPADTLNHDYDQLLIFLGVNMNASVDSMGTVTWGMDFSQIQSQGFLPQGYIIAVGCIRPLSSIYSSPGCTNLRDLFTDPQGRFRLTADDFANMVAADPYADPATAPQTPDPARYALVYSFSYVASPVQATITASGNNNSSVRNLQTTAYSYTVSASTSGSYDGVSLKDPTAFTWTNSSTLSNKTGSGDPSTTVVVVSPSAPTAPHGTLYMYQDTVYKTFMFSFEFVPPPH